MRSMLSLSFWTQSGQGLWFDGRQTSWCNVRAMPGLCIILTVWTGLQNLFSPPHFQSAILELNLEKFSLSSTVTASLRRRSPAKSHDDAHFFVSFSPPLSLLRLFLLSVLYLAFELWSFFLPNHITRDVTLLGFEFEISVSKL